MKTVILRNRVIIGGTVYMAGAEVSISDDLYSRFSSHGYVERLISETEHVEDEGAETEHVEDEGGVFLDNKRMPKGKTK